MGSSHALVVMLCVPVRLCRVNVRKPQEKNDQVKIKSFVLREGFIVL